MNDEQRRYIDGLIGNLQTSLRTVAIENSRDWRDMVGHDLRCLTHYWTEVVLPDLVYLESMTDDEGETE